MNYRTISARSARRGTGVAQGHQVGRRPCFVFSVSGKIVARCTACAAPTRRLSFKVDPRPIPELRPINPAFVPAHPYMARAFWITLVEPERFSRDDVTKFPVRHSYRACAREAYQAHAGDAGGEGNEISQYVRQVPIPSPRFSSPLGANFAIFVAKLVCRLAFTGSGALCWPESIHSSPTAAIRAC